MMALTPRRAEAKINSTINVTPMVDVMLVLLIIFMVITPMLQQGVPLEMAKTNHSIEMSDANNADAPDRLSAARWQYFSRLRASHRRRAHAKAARAPDQPRE
jgi:hypothetical protein